MDKQAQDRLADYKVDIAAVLDGSRPLAIVEHIKSPDAYKLAYSAAARRAEFGKSKVHALIWVHDVLSSNGKNGHAVALAADLGTLARYQHLRNNAQEYTRAGYQKALGALLGYEPAAIAEFTGSEIGLTCPCELCGSRAHKNQVELDAYKARTLPQVSKYTHSI